LLEYLDPDLMKMQFQMSSMRQVGDPVMYFTMYPGRFASAHLQGVDARAGLADVPRGTLTAKPTAEQEAARGARAGGGGAAAAGGRAGGGAPAAGGRRGGGAGGGGGGGGGGGSGAAGRARRPPPPP